MTDVAGTITQGTLRTTDGRVLPLEATEVEARIAGPVADVVVRQRFRNSGADPIEATYLFPLPHEASVHRMCFKIQDRVVRAVVKEKAEARRAYERAMSEGRAATLLEEDRPSLFSLSVANIAPGAVIEVELAYQEVVAFDDGHFRFVFPMVAPERYRDSAPPVAPGTLAPPRMPTGERPPDVALSVVVRADGAVETLRCASHRTETERLAEGGVRVRLPEGAPIKNRDFVLTWQASGSGVRPRVHFEREAGQTGTFLLLVTPSEPRDDGRGAGQEGLRALRCGNCGGAVTDMSAIRDIPGVGPVVPCRYCGAILAPGTEPVTRALRARDVVILVDRSASMRGSLPQARRAALAVMSALPFGDGVQLIAFDHDRDALDGEGKGFLSVAPEVIERADHFLSSLRPRGGTEMEEALARAGQLPFREGRTRVVVLITDATIGNEGRLLRRVPELIGVGARLYVLGVGGSVDRRLCARLAEAGGGAHDVILPDEDVEVTVTRFARRVREGGPILKDLGIFMKGTDMNGVYPSPVPDLFGGQPICILGRFDEAGPTRLVITGRTVHDKPYRQEIDVELPARSSEVPGLARLWARRHVEALAARVEVEPHRRDLKQQALALSLEHTIVGPYTSLVAEDSQPTVKPPEPPKPPPAAAKVEEEEEDEAYEEEEEEEEEEEGEGKEDAVLSSLAEDELATFGEPVGSPVLDDLFDDDAEGPSTGAPASGEHFEGGSRPASGASARSGVVEMRFSAPKPAAPEDIEVDALVAAPRSAPASLAYDELRAPVSPPAARRSYAPPPSSHGAPVAKSVPPPAAFAPDLALFDEPVPAPEASPPALPASVPPAGALFGASYSPSFTDEPAADTDRGPAPPSPPVQMESPGSEPYPDEELRVVRDRLRGELDLVFLVDATGSMGPYIEEVQRHLVSLVRALRSSPLCKSLRVGVVSYRDHPPEETSYVTRTLELTDDMEAVSSAVQQLSARGGGDGPEAVTDGLFQLPRLAWRPGAAKAVVWFGDAPPHGVEPSGDGFPGGCPCGHHWYTQAESCREMGIAVYAIGCYPTLGQYAGAEAVYKQVASTSRGLFLPLSATDLLVPIIAGAAVSELDRQRIDEHVADLAASCPDALSQTTESERVRWLLEGLRSRGVRPRAVHLQGKRRRAAPLKFRDLLAEDVEGSLSRLRATGRI